MVLRLTQNIRQVTNGKWRRKRQQDLCNQPKRAEFFKTSKHILAVSLYTLKRDATGGGTGRREKSSISTGQAARFGDSRRLSERFSVDIIVSQ
jgi:hypothetical protein